MTEDIHYQLWEQLYAAGIVTSFQQYPASNVHDLCISAIAGTHFAMLSDDHLMVNAVYNTSHFGESTLCWW